MARPYRLVILGRDDAWAKDVQDRVEARSSKVVRGTEIVEFTRVLGDKIDPAEQPRPTVVAYLADAQSRDDDAIVEALRTARERLLPVLPLTHKRTGLDEILPKIVQPLNAKPWDRAEAQAVQALLDLLGLIEHERRVFISYARSETSALALQLRTKLSERGFDVFLDRFSIQPADDFQKRLTIELADKAFVLFLETPAAIASEWVEYEIAFAHDHQIALLALLLPPGNEHVAQGRQRLPLPARARGPARCQEPARAARPGAAARARRDRDAPCPPAPAQAGTDGRERRGLAG